MLASWSCAAPITRPSRPDRLRVAVDVLYYLKVAQGNAGNFRYYYRKCYPLKKFRPKPDPVVAPDGPRR